MKNYKDNLILQEEGVSIVLAVIILSFSLSIALGVNVIFIRQLKMMREMGYSVVSFYAADHGIENALLQNPPQNASGTLNGASFNISVKTGGEEGCPNPPWNYCIKSVGIYEGTKRAVEVAY